MPKRKKYPKLPNGYGSIKFLGKGRRNPYAVHPPTIEFNLHGAPKTPKAICYVDAWIKGFTVLTAYRAGKYYPGYEMTLEIEDTSNLEELAQKILADYNRSKGVLDEEGKTFEEVYQDFYRYKYEQDSLKKYSESAKYATKAAFKNCSVLHKRVFKELKHNDLQQVINTCPLKYASLELIVSLLHQMYAYADIYELVDKDYSAHIKINKEDEEESGIPFSDEEMQILWSHKEDPNVEFILIMCYSGFRISAFKTLEINLHEGYFKGGVKTKTSKGRLVPIHSGIYKLVESRIKKNGCLLSTSIGVFRKNMYSTLKHLGIEKHTPHDCRHTFSALCERYNLNENDRKRLLGHSFGTDITNSVYGHRTLDELRAEIEKIKICY